MHVEAQWSCEVAVCDKYWFCVSRVSVYLDWPLENTVHCAIWSKYIKMTLLCHLFSLSRMNSLWLWIMHSLKKKRYGPSGKSVTHTLSHAPVQVFSGGHGFPVSKHHVRKLARIMLDKSSVFPVHLHSWQGHSLNIRNQCQFGDTYTFIVIIFYMLDS